MNKKVLIIGPWIGEFSYELCWWAPKIRKLCRERYKDYYKVHVGFAGRDIFYRDFIDELRFYPPEVSCAIGEAIGANECIPATTGLPTSGSVEARQFFDQVVEDFRQQGYEVDMLLPDGMIPYRSTFMSYPDGDYIHLIPEPSLVENFQKLIGDDYIFILSRHRQRTSNHNDNWRKDQWTAYFKKIRQETGLKLVTIEHDQVYSTSDIEAIRCSTVEEQMALMVASRFCVTGSTGAAALCYFLDKDALIFFDSREEVRKRIHMKWQLELLSEANKICIHIAKPDINNMKLEDAVSATLAFSTEQGRQTLPRFNPEDPTPYWYKPESIMFRLRELIWRMTNYRYL